LLKNYELLNILFPQLTCGHDEKIFDNFIMHGLKDVDHKIGQRQELNPAYLIAVFLWHAVCKIAKEDLAEEKVSEFLAYKNAAEKLLTQQNKIISISKKLMVFIKDIWVLQVKLSKIAGKPGKRADKLLSSVKFNAAFDFLLLRAMSGDKRAQKILSN